VEINDFGGRRCVEVLDDVTVAGAYAGIAGVEDENVVAVFTEKNIDACAADEYVLSIITIERILPLAA
jgi:hypothetical protein